ncbi:hypothetical protein AYI68_g6546 [Smittium mucronatum]|uniref:Uncharacterized protein n=1 Tax=Smittium mucronatum TaxID=133383 RepID=A0A1R0GR61_9FUNG|nr:hypothetical protein AYI68_g6546 [Smittium mucronatum]
MLDGITLGSYKGGGMGGGCFLGSSTSRIWIQAMLDGIAGIYKEAGGGGGRYLLESSTSPIWIQVILDVIAGSYKGDGWGMPFRILHFSHLDHSDARWHRW